MELQLKRLELITDIHSLVQLKEKLKNDTMDPMLKWHERMEIYKTIQGIKERIDELHTLL